MGEVIVTSTKRERFKKSATNFQDISHNSLVLSHIVAYLPPSSITRLTATNRALRDAITHTPGIYRHLDLQTVKKAHIDGGEVSTSTQLDESLTEDDFHAAPLRDLFSTLQRRNILQDVQTLVLDGLSVTADFCHDIINGPEFKIRLLSIRDVKNLNHGKLRGALQYACRPSRDGSPRLKGIYLFGPKDDESTQSATPRESPTAVGPDQDQRSSSALTEALQRSDDAWWDVKGRQLMRPIQKEWANCLLACSGVIAFDALLCQGPRHHNSRAAGHAKVLAELGPAVATYSLSGCQGCGKAPEGLISPSSHTVTDLPLLAPLPILCSSLRAATAPSLTATAFVPRCAECIRERYCHCCNTWWCESCYQLRGQGSQHEPAVVIVDDTDNIGQLEDYMFLEEAIPKQKCEDCIDKTQRVCKKCCAGYCTVHNEGSSAEFCDWCVSRGRRLAKTKAHDGSSPPPSMLRDIRHLNHIRRKAGF
ncbi:hypothetical protein BBO_08490 [Beauveria brongniartii RCEF 3172]|uniref:Uncharacterized protein n=1 Tax=Beauveria brongniartii RCEF 3172 TaxID=1081107 RepID=A0A166XI10_9HYPO|nr:hypothetical protein BBO_08490 [Beauveria brongniartii RCEF 3172]